ncbi:small ribosomal subunit protein eS8-like [Oscarella lobularis]|uniref:small ribosomal subunit protein eS8-like n=1 Tax=Oscarella lobularis TaxID=121494 RepID=UPI0033134FF7
MGISRDSWHKRRNTGGHKNPLRKKRKFELGRPPANTRIGAKRIHTVRTRGGNEKRRGLRLENGNYSWGSEAITRKSRIIDVVYNASNNELVRTKTLVKNCIVQVDSTPFRQWFETHYCVTLGRKKPKQQKDKEAQEQSPQEPDLNKKRSRHAKAKIAARKPGSKVDPHLEEQFVTGRLYACISSRPGQCGRADGYILEGKELEFYLRKFKAKKAK